MPAVLRTISQCHSRQAEHSTDQEGPRVKAHLGLGERLSRDSDRVSATDRLHANSGANPNLAASSSSICMNPKR